MKEGNWKELAGRAYIHWVVRKVSLSRWYLNCDQQSHWRQSISGSGNRRAKVPEEGLAEGK
jgi:hypothetical protein